MATELATAYVSLVPSFKGGAAAISSQMKGPATSAGATAGAGLGGALVGGMKGVVAKLAPAALITGLGAGLVGIGKTFKGVTDTIIVGTGASGKALDGLVESAKNVGKNTASPFSDIGVAIADLNTRLGLTGPPLESMAKKFLDLSRITGTDLQQNIGQTTRVFGDWGIATKDQAGALDVIFEATKRTGIGLDTLTNNVVQFGAPLRQMGFGFEESIALFAKWEREGVNTQTVLGGLRIGLGKLAKAGEDPPEAFRRITEEIKNAGSTAEANALSIEAFGARAGPDMAAAIREGRFEIDELVDGLMSSGGALDDAATRTTGLSESWQMFKNKALIAIEPIATRVFNALSTGMAFVTAHSGPVLVLAGIIGGALVLAFTAWAISATAAAAATIAATWPVLAIGAAVAGLVFLITKLWRENETFRKVVKAVWNAVKAAISAVVSWITGTVWPSIKRAFNQMIGAAKAVWNGIKTAWNGVKSAVSSSINAVRGFIGNLVGWFKALPGRVVSALASFGSKLLSVGRKALGQMHKGVADRFKSLRDFVKGIPGRVLSALGNLARLLWNAGASIMRGLLDGIKAGFENVKNFVGGIGSWIANNKGPRNYDLALLRPAGNWILTGLLEGLRDQMPSLRKTLNGIATTIRTAPLEAPEIPAAAGRLLADLQARQRVEVDVRGADSDMVRMIRKWFRTRNL